MNLLAPVYNLLNRRRFQTRPKHHEGPWIDRPDALQILKSKTQDSFLLKAAEEVIINGYTIVPSSVAESCISNSLQEYNSWVEKNKSKDKNYSTNAAGFNSRLVNFHCRSLGTFELFSSNQKALRLMDLLFDHETSVYTSLYFQHGTQQDLHRDSPVFRTEPENWYLGYWVALEDVTNDNGPLQFIPKGHRVEVTHPHEFAKARFTNLEIMTENECQAHLWAPYQQHIVDTCSQQGLTVATAPMKKGDTLIWHPSLPHGGSKILNPNLSRHSVVFHVVPVGTPVYQAEAFFKKPREYPLDRGWRYVKHGERYFVDFGRPEFMPSLA